MKLQSKNEAMKIIKVGRTWETTLGNHAFSTDNAKGQSYTIASPKSGDVSQITLSKS